MRRLQLSVYGMLGIVSVQAVDTILNASTKEMQQNTELLFTTTEGMHTNLIVGFSLAFLFIMIAAGGGVGGGSVLDAIYFLIMRIQPYHATPLASITVFGGAVANLILNIRKARRQSQSPLIDWDLLLVMQPMLIFGNSIGSFIISIAPNWLLYVLLIAVIGALGFRTFQRAFEARRRERWSCCGYSDNSEASGPLIGAYNLPRRSNGRQISAIIPWKKVGAYFLLFAGIILLDILITSGVASSSFFLPLVALLPSIFLTVFCHFSFRSLTQRLSTQQQPYYIISQDEIQWSPQSIFVFPIASIAAGIIAGTFRLEGGIINGPLLLELGVEPTAASAITAATVLFASAMDSVNYIRAQSLNWHLVKYMLPMGMIGTYLGHIGLMRIVHKYNYPSLVIFSMAIVILCYAITMFIGNFPEFIGHGQ